ncbi:MAG: lipoyl(octanoyl) transferase LipB [Verrucomicrobia bacterium]|nr:lipoyl(octanoyl) transferase LipB [Verrucomicrobiota bacterium]
MKFVDIGRITFEAALELQQSQLEHCLATGDEVVFLLEHEPVYTIGRIQDKSSLGEVHRLPYPTFEINRGGQATYHGPGQLVAYPILDLRTRGRDLHLYLRNLESVLISLLAGFGVPAQRLEGKTGVWVEQRKIASIGVGIRKWISMHGVALNVASDLHGFGHIIPCGLAGVTMTSLSRELGREVTVAEVKDRFSQHFARTFVTPRSQRHTAGTAGTAYRVHTASTADHGDHGGQSSHSATAKHGGKA